jgi:hypothetical protein
MGGSAADVTKVLDDLTLESTKVSLKGLTGTALTDALNSVISKSMDEIAAAAFPQLDQFRQVGEGYAETVMRIAGDYAKLDSILARYRDCSVPRAWPASPRGSGDRTGWWDR